MTNGVVLHTQKVAGISGSEAHLLQLLPDLRARGWDVRFLMLHEDEPGAWEFAGELRAWSPLDDVRLRADVDPLAFGKSSRTSRARDPGSSTRTSSTPMSTASSRAHPRPVPAFDEARVQRVSGRTLVRARGSVCRLARPRSHRDLTGARAVPRRDGRIRREDFEIVHYGIASDGTAAPYGEATHGCSASAA